VHTLDVLLTECADGGLGLRPPGLSSCEPRGRARLASCLESIVPMAGVALRMSPHRLARALLPTRV